MRVLLVEDDAMLGDAVVQGLRQDGYAVDWIRDGAEAAHALRHETYAVVLLDVMLPGSSGLDVVKGARAAGIETPILMLTARDEVTDRVKGLDAGADDYLAKPFSLDEVLARIRALTRRHAGRRTPTLRLGAVEIDPATRTVTVGNDPVDLSRHEFNILRALAEAHGKVLSRRQIEDTLYSWGGEIESNAVEVHIHHLRRKLGSGLIQTVRGVGYRVKDE